MNRADLLKSASLACGAIALNEGAAATPTDADRRRNRGKSR